MAVPTVSAARSLSWGRAVGLRTDSWRRSNPTVKRETRTLSGSQTDSGTRTATSGVFFPKLERRLRIQDMAHAADGGVEHPRPEGRGFLDYAQRYSAHVSV